MPHVVPASPHGTGGEGGGGGGGLGGGGGGLGRGGGLGGGAGGGGGGGGRGGECGYWAARTAFPSPEEIATPFASLGPNSLGICVARISIPAVTTRIRSTWRFFFFCAGVSAGMADDDWTPV